MKKAKYFVSSVLAFVVLIILIGSSFSTATIPEGMIEQQSYEIETDHEIHEQRAHSKDRSSSTSDISGYLMPNQMPYRENILTSRESMYRDLYSNQNVIGTERPDLEQIPERSEGNDPFKLSDEEYFIQEHSLEGSSIQQSKNGDKLDFVPGELLIGLKDGVKLTFDTNRVVRTGIKSIDELNNEYGVQTLVPLGQNRNDKSQLFVYKVHFSDDIDVYSMAEEYENNPHILFAEPNGFYEEAVIPDDPYFDELWGLHNTGQTGGTPDADIDAIETWDIHTGDEDTIIAIIDSGIDYYHEDLSEKIWINHGEDINGNGIVDDEDFNGIDDDQNGFIDDLRGWDFVYNDNNPNDIRTHGTHCSGTAAALSDNGIGISGVCWNSVIMAVKVLNDDGQGYWTDIADGIVYAADMGADVISMSIQGQSYSDYLALAVDYALSKDVVLVACAGNWNSQIISYPAGYDGVLSVAATDHNDKKASFSNFGEWIYVSGPGVDILSTEPSDSYGYKSGTSMATPHVAGLAALIRSYVPSFTYHEVLQRIIEYTDNIDDVNPGYEGLLGSGRINAYEALPKYEHNIGVKDISTTSSHVKPFDPITIGTSIFNSGIHDENDIVVIFRVDNEEIDQVIIPLIERNTYQYVEFLWIPEEPDIYSISINATITNVIEEYYNDNEKSITVVAGVHNTDTDECFETIQQAIDDADTIDGHSIVAPCGLYKEHVVINKSISLIGLNRDNTIIESIASDISVIEIEDANSIHVSGFSLRNGTCGVYVKSVSNTEISDNVISDNIGAGIYLFSSYGSLIFDNIIANNNQGIYNTDLSISNTIYDNNILDNQQGILFDTQCSNNQIYHNWLSNSDNAYDGGSDNKWDNDYHNGYHPGGGNWWSDYDGVDELSGPNQDEPGSDMVGDIPYSIAGGNNKDRYPLMEPHYLPIIIYVDDDNIDGPWDGTEEFPYKTIHEAINKADEGSLIFVKSGIYFNSIYLTKSIKLVGEDPYTTGIIGDSYYDIFITKDSVNITGFTIINEQYQGGIFLARVTNCSITNNYMESGGIYFTSDEYINDWLTVEQWNTHTINGNYIGGKPIIYISNNQDPITIPENAGQVILANCTNVTINNLEIGYGVGLGIQLCHSSFNTINNNEFTYSRYCGILLRNSTYNTVENNNIFYVESYDGIDICYSSGFNTLNNNFIANCGDIGTFIWDSPNTTIINSSYTECSASIYIYSSSNNTVSKCISNASANGIIAYDSSNCGITKNHILRSGFSGIDIYEGEENTISHNTIINTRFYGIFIALSNKSIIENNTIKVTLPKWKQVNGAYYSGLDVLNSEFNTIINNVLSNVGFHIQSNSFDEHQYTSHIIENNIVNNRPIYYYKNMVGPYQVPSDAGQVFLINCSYFSIQNLNISNVSVGINLVFSSNCTINDVIVSNSYGGIAGLSCSDIVINNCVVKQAQWSGIGMVYGSRNTIINSTCYDNIYMGFELFENSSSIINCSAYDNGLWGFCIGSAIQDGSEVFSNISIINSTAYNNWWGGMEVVCVNDVIIKGNNLYNNGVYGIIVYSVADSNISNNLITDTRSEIKYNEVCQLLSPYFGSSSGIIVIGDSSNNVITRNIISQNNFGIYIIENSFFNRIYHNNFLNNMNNSYEEPRNIWDNGYPSGGNFWDDYDGKDENMDGICETPYPIQGSNNVDKYPLRDPVITKFYLQNPKTVHIDDDYNSSVAGWQYNRFNNIQNGLDDVVENGKININNGTYQCNIVINKPLTIQGAGINTVKLFPQQPGISLIQIINTQDVILSSLSVSDSEYGIKIQSSNDVTIKQTNISNNHIGLYLTDNSNSSIIENNTLSNNSEYGIHLEYCNDAIILFNDLIENEIGLYVDDQCSNNIFYNNIFINNVNNALDYCLDSQWDGGYGIRGNFWSDYTGEDEFRGPNQDIIGSDGVGDNPYIIPEIFNQDKYPLMVPYDPGMPAVINMNSGKVFSTIQQAIDDEDTANSNTILVRSGIYHENVNIDKSINLIGENHETTFVYGDAYGSHDNGMLLTANEVTISGFTIRNSFWYAIYIESHGNTIENNVLTKNSGGVVIDTTTGNTISNNIISYNNPRHGIWVADSTDTNIFGNNIKNNGESGIWFGSWDDGNKDTNIIGNSIIDDGIYVNYASNFDITGNNFQEYCAIEIFKSDSCSITRNNLKGNDFWHGGILLKYTDECEILGNTVSNIDEYALSISSSDDNVIIKNSISDSDYGIIASGSNGNYIYHNSLARNYRHNAKISNCDGTVWDDGYPSGGNYWDDYYGADQNDDGLGDSPYEIIGEYPHDQDRYPLIIPWEGELPKPDIVFVNSNYDENTHGWGFNKFATIQDGIDAVKIEGSVFVESGLYEETLIIDKSLKLIGESHTTTIIQGNQIENIISIQNLFEIEISGFTITSGVNGIYIINSNDISIFETTIENNNIGILITDQSSEITISDNQIIANQKGIKFTEGTSDSKSYHNNFLNNGVNHAIDNANNQWNSQYPSGGNYWDDYSGDDQFCGPDQDIPGSDGIGDSPYSIAGGNSQDRYPLMEQYQPSDVSVENINTGKSFETIQQAIDDPDTLDGHYICVHKGIYEEQLTINKAVKYSEKIEKIHLLMVWELVQQLSYLLMILHSVDLL